MLAPLGAIGVVYASLLTGFVDAGPVHRAIRVIILPAVLAIAVIGLVEIAAREETREMLVRLYERGTGGLPPYVMLVVLSLSLLYSSLATSPSHLLSLVVYMVAVALYARCARVSRTTVHLATGVIAGLLALALALLAGMSSLGMIVASVTASVPHVAPLLVRRDRRIDDVLHLCTLYPVIGLSIAILVLAGLRSYMPNIHDLVSHVIVYGVTGVIGWSSIVAVAAAVESEASLVKRIVESDEVRIASGLALVLIAAEALGIRNSTLVATVVVAGFVVAVLNNMIGRTYARA